MERRCKMIYSWSIEKIINFDYIVICIHLITITNVLIKINLEAQFILFLLLLYICIILYEKYITNTYFK